MSELGNDFSDLNNEVLIEDDYNELPDDRDDDVEDKGLNDDDEDKLTDNWEGKKFLPNRKGYISSRFTSDKYKRYFGGDYYRS